MIPIAPSSAPPPHRRPRRLRPHVAWCTGAPRVTALVAAVLLATMASATVAAAPGAWGAGSQDREHNRQRQREVKAALDLATASDGAVEAELGRLDQAVAAQRARADDAHRAETAAQVRVRQATDTLAAIDGRVRGLRRQLADQAIQAYTDPSSQGGLMAITRARSLGDVSRRQTFLDLVRSSTTGVVEGLRSTRQDQEAAARQLEAARKAAAERSAVEATRTKSLVATQATQQATHAELQRRIEDLQSESRVLAGQEQALQELIRTRSAAVAAQTPGGGSGPGGVVASGSSSSAGLIWPIRGPVTSEFGPRWGSFHAGIDIAVPTGVPIGAARGGVVVFSGPNGGYGNFVVIDHGNGLATAYAHQSRIAVSEGQSVAQGEVIGYVGSTGHSTGPHLHFEVRVNGTAQNPRNYLPG